MAAPRHGSLRWVVRSRVTPPDLTRSHAPRRAPPQTQTPRQNMTARKKVGRKKGDPTKGPNDAFSPDETVVKIAGLRSKLAIALRQRQKELSNR